MKLKSFLFPRISPIDLFQRTLIFLFHNLNLFFKIMHSQHIMCRHIYNWNTVEWDFKQQINKTKPKLSNLEAGDNQSLKIWVARPGIEPRSSCSASRELNHSAIAAPPTCIDLLVLNLEDLERFVGSKYLQIAHVSKSASSFTGPYKAGWATARPRASIPFTTTYWVWIWKYNDNYFLHHFVYNCKTLIYIGATLFPQLLISCSIILTLEKLLVRT